MPALSAVLSTCVGRHRKFGEVFCMDYRGQGNDFELIPTVEMETRNPLEGYFIIVQCTVNGEETPKIAPSF